MSSPSLEGLVLTAAQQYLHWTTKSESGHIHWYEGDLPIWCEEAAPLGPPMEYFRHRMIHIMDGLHWTVRYTPNNGDHSYTITVEGSPEYYGRSDEEAFLKALTAI